MATTPVQGWPYPLESDAPDVAADIHALALALDAVAKIGGYAGPVVTSLPGSPVDTQECSLLVDATNGIVWRFKYRAASSSPYKWEFIGGPPLYNSVDAFEVGTGTLGVYTAMAGPLVVTIPTLPSGGDFDISVSAGLQGSAAGAVFASYKVGGTAASDSDALELFSSSGATWIVQGTRTRRKTGVASAAAITAQYRATAGSVSAQYRSLSVLPVRVG